MTRSRRTGIALSLGATALLLSGCGDFWGTLGDPPLSSIEVHNDGAETFFAGTTDYERRPASGELIEDGVIAQLTWSKCGTRWLVLSEREDVESDEIGRHQLELCPGDSVRVSSDYELTIECGEQSLSTREADC